MEGIYNVDEGWLDIASEQDWGLNIEQDWGLDP